MQRVSLSFLFLISCNVFGAANEKPFDLQGHIEEIIRETNELNAREFFGGFIGYGDFPSKDNPLYEQLVEAAQKKVNKCDRKGKSTLHHAAAGRSVELVTLLAGFGLRFDQVDYSGQIPLHGAACGSFEMLEFVLNNTPKELINKKDMCEKNVTFPRSEWPEESLPRGRTPLHYALRIIDGARQKSDKNKQIPVDETCAKIELLHAFGADVNISDGFWGSTVLHWSVFHPIQVMATLLQLDADPNIKNLRDRTVLDELYMTLRKTPGLVDGPAKRELLLGHGARATDYRISLKPRGKRFRIARVDDVRPTGPQPRVPEWRNRSRQQHARGARSGYVAPRLSRADASDNWRERR